MQPPSPAGTCPRTGGGGVWASALWRGERGSRLLIPPNAPTPKAALLHREAAPGSYRSETGAAGGGGGEDRVLRVSGGGRGDASDPPRAPPRAGSRVARATWARGPSPPSTPSPGGGQAARHGLPYVARPGNCPPGATNPAPRARLELLPAAFPLRSLGPGRPAPARQGLALSGDTGRGLEPGLRSSGRRALSPAANGAPSHAGPRAPRAAGGRCPSPHPGRRLPTRTPPRLPSSGNHKSQKNGPTPQKRAPQTRRRGMS